MAKISNDHDLRDTLNAMNAEQQRILGARFAQSVIHLCNDDRVRRAAETALSPDAAITELEDALRAARAYATKTYTDCGKDTDWLAQADHFVAAAVAAALTPPAQLSEKMNPAWKAAVQARMAKNCEMMEEDEGEEEGEPERQYRIAGESI
jgi:hypothetical protein